MASIFNHRFSSLGAEEPLNGVAPDRSAALNPSFPTWTAGSQVKGSGSVPGMYIDLHTTSSASLVFQNPVWEDGVDVEGGFSYRSDDSVGIVGNPPDRPPGRWIEQSVVNGRKLMQFNVGVHSGGGNLMILVAHDPDGPGGTSAIVEWTVGTVGVPDVSALNRVTWSYDAASYTISADNGYEVLEHTLSAGAQSSFTGPPLGTLDFHICGVSILYGGGPTIVMTEANVGPRSTILRQYPRDDNQGIGISGSARVPVVVAKSHSKSQFATQRHGRVSRSTYL